MNKPSFVRVVYLSGALALGALQGCATMNGRTQPQPEKYTPALTTSYEDQQQQWKERREKQGKGIAGDAAGRFIGEGLLRILVP
ncbi:hypothetical protein EXS73_03510 [Candidatus Pacearchaeota archaeon]|nr:hypothetical protein [Candidatus Pacearchaeota archaeon]